MWSDFAAERDTPGGEAVTLRQTSRRGFLRCALGAPVAVALLSGGRKVLAAQPAAAQPAAAPAGDAKGPFELPPLPYSFGALEPHIDARTMQIHHDRHHATYVKNLNDLAAKTPELKNKTPEQLIRDVNSLPEAVRAGVRNNGGGHVNHTMFWQIMKPGGGGAPSGAVGEAIKGTFNSFDAFKTAFNDAGAKRFGSGWVWLVHGKDGKLAITTTANQDNPLMEGAYPILGNDVWEHAYYLKYQNRRADYLAAWWNTVNWDVINRRMTQARLQGQLRST